MTVDELRASLINEYSALWADEFNDYTEQMLEVWSKKKSAPLAGAPKTVRQRGSAR